MGVTVEQQVERFMRAANRPYSLQLLVDAHQKYAIKKSQLQKALDSLVDKGEITAKEFGKSKLFWLCQKELPTLPKEEMDARTAELGSTEEERHALEKEVSALKAEKAALSSTMTLAEVEKQSGAVASEIKVLEAQVAELEAANTSTMSPEDQKKYEQAFEVFVDAWRKRKGIFRGCWDTISENLPGKTADLYEEIGVETDEEAGVDLRSATDLLKPKPAAPSTLPKRRRVQ